MSNINIIDTLGTSVQGLSVQAYTSDEGWSKDHVHQRAVIDESHDKYAELKSLKDKKRIALESIDLVLKAWLDGNAGFEQVLNENYNYKQYLVNVAHDNYDGVNWKHIENVGTRKAFRSAFKSFAKSNQAVLFRLYHTKIQELEASICEVAIKAVSKHVDEQVNVVKNKIHDKMAKAIRESGNYASVEVEGLVNDHKARICYTILHNDFLMTSEEHVEREKRSRDKVAHQNFVISVEFNADGRDNYASGDKDSHVKQVALGHIKYHEKDGNNIRYFVEEDYVYIRNGGSNLNFNSRDSRQIKRLKLLLTCVMEMADIENNAVWARRDWMSQVHCI